MTRKRLGIYHVIIFVLIVYSLFIGIDIQNIALISSNSARNDVLNDNLCFLNYDIPNILLGIGIPYQKSLLIEIEFYVVDYSVFYVSTLLRY